MAEGETSLKKRVTPTKGEKSISCHDDGDNSWSTETHAKYQREGVRMVLGGPVTKNIRKLVQLVFNSDYCKDVSPEQGLVNYVFRGSYTQGLDSEYYMVHRTRGPAMYPTFSAVYNQDGLRWSTIERYTRSKRPPRAVERIGGNSAGVQTMQRRMMLQLGFLEREGCIRLDQV
jgi:hypothetical protein